MNRTDFMAQLERLLRNISPSEKEEALQYYNDYFDDAGAENEQEVIEALGNPARVAESIRRDLPGSAGENVRRKAVASDKAVIEYGKEEPGETKEETGMFPEKVQEEQEPSQKAYFEGESLMKRRPLAVTVPEGAEGSGRSGVYGQSGAPGQGRAYDQSGAPGQGGAYGQDSASGQSRTYGQDSASGQSRTYGQDSASGQSRTYSQGGASGQGGTYGQGGAPGKRGLAGWAVVLIVIGAVFASPLAIGVLSLLFGIAVTWFAFIFAFGIVALALFVLLVVLVVVGIECVFVDPLVGVAIVGAGMVCGGIGILFLMLTVVLAGIVTPAVFRGIGWLLRGGRSHSRKREAVV